MNTVPETVRVLHVDDDPDFADLAAEFLEREDDRFVVETAEDARSGLERLAEGEFDCVVSDYDMPGRNGIEFLEAVRADHPDLPFVLFTGKGSEEVAADAISAGVTDYLQKEAGSDQYAVLANRIRNAVARARADRDRRRQLEAIETAREGISILDEEGRYVYVNEAFADLHGYEPDELIGEGWELVYPEADVPQVEEEILPTVERTGHWRGQTTSLRADGSTLVVDHTLATTERGGLVCTVRDASGRIERERELETEQAFVEQALDAIEDLFYVVGTDGRLRRWNDRLPAVTGYGDEEIAEMEATEFVAEADRAAVAEAVEETLSGGEAIVEADLLTADGERIPYELTGDRLTGPDGDPIGVIGIGRDLSGREERERELRRTTARLEALFEGSPDMINVHDPAGNILDPNPRLCEATGYDAAALTGMKIWELDEAIDPEEARALWAEMDVGDSRRLEGTYRRADGSTFPVQVHVRRISLEGEDRFVAFARDVTERQERERELRQQNERLQELADERAAAETRYRSLFESAPVVIWEHDASEARRRVDELAAGVEDLEAHFEANPGELEHVLDGIETLGVNETALEYYGADSKEQVIERFDELLTGEGIEANRQFFARVPEGATEHRSEITVRTFDGELKHEVFEIRVPEAYAEDFSRMYTTGTDITDRRERERELERQNERLDEFAGIVSHDLRNPLNVAEGNVELAREEFDSEHLDDAAAALDRMGRLLEDLLALARDGEAPDRTEAVALDGLADDCWGTVATTDATLRVETDRTVEADRSRLRQLLENLYRNAVEHGGESVTVTVGGLEDGFYVEDDGSGIPPDGRERVFEAGYSTSDDGTGLGLNIVEGIAEAHGWEVRATEGSAGGARFEVAGVAFADG